MHDPVLDAVKEEQSHLFIRYQENVIIINGTHGDNLQFLSTFQYGTLLVDRVYPGQTVAHGSQYYGTLRFFQGRYVVFKTQYSFLILVKMTYLADKRLLDGYESVAGRGVEGLTVLGVDQCGCDVLKGVYNLHADLVIVNDVASVYDAYACIRVGCQQVSVGKRCDE